MLEVALAQVDVLVSRRAALELLQIDPHDVAGTGCVGRDGLVRALATAHDNNLIAALVRGRTSFGERLDQRHVTGQRIGARVAHLAGDEHTLAPVLLDSHRNLRVFEVALGELRLQLAFETTDGEAAGLNPADEWEREASIELNRVLAAEVSL